MPLSAHELVRFAILEDLVGGPRTGGELVTVLRSPASAAAAIGGEPVDLGAVKPALRELVEEGLVREYGSAGVGERAGEPLWAATVPGRTAFVALNLNRRAEELRR